jgi:hypothetical protein
MHQRDRLLRSVAAQAGIEVCSACSQLGGVENLHLESLALENALQEACTQQLVTGRIGGVDAEIVGEHLLGLACESVPIQGARLRHGSQYWCDGEREHNET